MQPAIVAPPRSTPPANTDRAATVNRFTPLRQRSKIQHLFCVAIVAAATLREREREDRSTAPLAVHLAVPRLLSIQFLVIRYLETISRVVLRVYTTLVIPWPACQPTHTLCSRKSNAFACGGVARVAGTRDRNNDDHLSSAPIQLRSLFFSSSPPFFLPRLVLLS